MKSTIDKWKSYIWEDTKSCSFELGYTIGELNNLAINYWEKFKKAYFTDNPQKFKQQLPELLVSKLNQMPDVTINSHVFDKLTNEMYKLLLSTNYFLVDESCDCFREDFVFALKMFATWFKLPASSGLRYFWLTRPLV